MRSYLARPAIAVLFFALLFVAAAMLFAPRLGIETDEAIIMNGIYDHGGPVYSWRFGKAELPLMIIAYMGAMKAWLYNVLFLVTPPRPVSLRLPMILAAAVALIFFFAALDRALGRSAAWIGLALLATDPSYLLLNTADYGPVALHFLFKLAACWFLLAFYRSGSRAALALGFFLLGLGLWDKAIFAWAVFGLAAAAVLVFPQEVLKRVTLRNTPIALVSIAMGALPLLAYNIARPFETIRSTTRILKEPVFAKAPLLFQTMDGSILFGFLTATEPGPVPGEPRHWFQALSLSIANWTHHPHRSVMFYAFLAAVAALPFLWKTPARPPMLFGLIACAATWIVMAITAGAGAAAHHIVLLWPFHLLVLGASIGQLPRPWAAGATAALCASNLLVLNQYYADLIRNGPAIRWTDAADPLESYLTATHPARIFTADWGFFETLTLLSEGELPMYPAGQRDPSLTQRMIACRGCVFVSHTAAFAYMPEIRAHIEDQARLDGFEEQHLATISDRNGRPTFDVFRFRKIHL